MTTAFSSNEPHQDQQQQQLVSNNNINNKAYIVARSLDDFLQDALNQSHAHEPLSSSYDTAATANTISSKYKLHQWRYWMIFVSLGVANSSDASEILCLSYILSYEPFQRDMLYHTAWRASLLAATVFLGMLIGGLSVGTLGDRLGRRPMLMAGLVTNTVAGLLSAAAPNVISLAACRLVSGLGIGASVPPLFTLCSELAAAADRGFWVTVAASFWMVGSIYVALVGWWLLGSVDINNDNDIDNADYNYRWRIFAAACALPSALGCFLTHALVPESPRFLALAGRHEQAVHVAQELADCLLYKGPPLTVQELLEHYPVSREEDDDDDDEDQRRLRRLRVPPLSMHHHTGGSTLASMGAHTSYIGSMISFAWTDFLGSTRKLYTVQLRQTTWPLQMVWFSLSFGSYGLLTWINTLFFQVHLKNVYFNSLLFALSNLPGNVLSALLMDRAGRATLLVGSVVAASLSLVAFAYVAYARDQFDNNTQDNTDNDKDAPQQLSTAWIVGAACAFQCFTISAWNAIDVMTSELFPTSVRSTGLGVCAASGRVGAMLAQFVNGALVAEPVLLLLVAAATLMLGALTPALLPAASDKTGQPVADRIDRVVARVNGNENETLDDEMGLSAGHLSSSSPSASYHGYRDAQATVAGPGNANANPDKLGSYHGLSNATR
jgi:VNT family MFS transporter (synaptic vesicle glycoprotein 2)